MAPLRVLIVSHTGRVSGGERSLLELLAGFDGSVAPLVASPPGEFTDRLGAAGRPWVPIHGFDASLRLHPVRTSRAILDLGQAAIAIRRTARRYGAVVIHANSVRAGLAAIGARRIGGPPVAVHVRDCLPGTRPGRQVGRVIRTGADMVIANSEYTAAALGAGRSRTRVAHSPVDMRRFADLEGLTPARARRQLGQDPGRPLLGVIAQMTPWKAQDDAIRALAQVQTRPRPRLLLAGDVVFDGPGTRYAHGAYLRGLHDLVDELGLGDDVLFMGAREDVPQILRALDLLLVPSWEEPFGRTVIEAMAAGTPVVATAAGGPGEIIRDGVDGTLVPPRRPNLWAAAIDRLLSDVPARQAHAARALETVAVRFGHTAHAQTVAAAYRELAGQATA